MAQAEGFDAAAKLLNWTVRGVFISVMLVYVVGGSLRNVTRIDLDFEASAFLILCGLYVFTNLYFELTQPSTTCT